MLLFLPLSLMSLLRAFLELLLCTRCYSQHLTCFVSFNLIATKYLARGPTAGKWQAWASDPVGSATPRTRAAPPPPPPALPGTVFPRRVAALSINGFVPVCILACFPPTSPHGWKLDRARTVPPPSYLCPQLAAASRKTDRSSLNICSRHKRVDASGAPPLCLPCQHRFAFPSGWELGYSGSTFWIP